MDTAAGNKQRGNGLVSPWGALGMQARRKKGPMRCKGKQVKMITKWVKTMETRFAAVWELRFAARRASLDWFCGSAGPRWRKGCRKKSRREKGWGRQDDDVVRMHQGALALLLLLFAPGNETCWWDSLLQLGPDGNREPKRA